MNTTDSFTKVDAILDHYQKDSTKLIAIMQEVQGEYRYLPEPVLDHIANQLDISVAKVYGVATSYENFSLEPKGKYVIRICDGTACHVRKSLAVLKAFQTELDLTDKKHTTDDMQFTLETVACLGACGLAPVCTVNDKVYPAMTPDKARELVTQLREEEDQND